MERNEEFEKLLIDAVNKRQRHENFLLKMALNSYGLPDNIEIVNGKFDYCGVRFNLNKHGTVLEARRIVIDNGRDKTISVSNYVYTFSPDVTESLPSEDIETRMPRKLLNLCAMLDMLQSIRKYDPSDFDF